MNIVIDAHHHLPDPARTDYPWLTPDLAAIDRRFGPEDLVPELEATGIDRTMLAQTISSLDETREFLALNAAQDILTANPDLVLLLAAKFGMPVCPHAGGVGLCELVQDMSAFDHISVSGRLEGRMIEYVDHLHEHFLDPGIIRGGRNWLPTLPGYSAEMRSASVAQFRYPGGSAWS